MGCQEQTSKERDIGVSLCCANEISLLNTFFFFFLLGCSCCHLLLCPLLSVHASVLLSANPLVALLFILSSPFRSMEVISAATLCLSP